MEKPKLVLPAASTIGGILKREGLIIPGFRRRRPAEQGKIIAHADEPNDEWAMDFKGWFRTCDGIRIDPLTVSDTASRYLIAAQITPPTHDGVKAVLERVFKEIGLPKAIRSDNGVPFGSPGAGGISRLSIWFLKLGIEPLHIRPASPQDNGRHERMHRTMKAETARPPAESAMKQQVRFDMFRRVYNEDRPHEALGQKTPASCWRRPTRTMPDRLTEAWYDPDHEVRHVDMNGTITWRGKAIFISEALARQKVALLEHECGGYLVRFYNRDLGLIDQTGRFHRFAPPHARLRCVAEPAETKEQ